MKPAPTGLDVRSKPAPTTDHDARSEPTRTTDLDVRLEPARTTGLDVHLEQSPKALELGVRLDIPILGPPLGSAAGTAPYPEPPKTETTIILRARKRGGRRRSGRSKEPWERRDRRFPSRGAAGPNSKHAGEVSED